MLVNQPWLMWALLSAVFAAMTAVFAKVGLSGVDSDQATWVRTLFIAVVLGAFLVWTGKWRASWQFGGKTWLFLALSALATGASWVCYFRALQLGNAAQVAPVDKFSVVLVAVLAVVFLGERLNLREWVGIALVTAGVVVLAIKR